MEKSQITLNETQKQLQVNMDITEQEQEKLQQFKQKLHEENLWEEKYDDYYLLRFLKARKFDLKETLIMWQSFIKWRKHNHVDQIKDFEFKEIDLVRKYYPHGYQGTDKEGRPIYIERIGQIHYKELFSITTEDRMIKYYTQSYENLVHEILTKCSHKAGKNVQQSCIILDLAGISLSLFNNKVKHLIEQASKLAQDNYPEILGQMYIVNAPYLFSAIWSAIKIFIDKKTQNKIKILGSDYKRVLLENIDKDQLPTFLGGTQPDLLSRNQGPWNPLGLELFGSKDDIKRKNDEILKSYNQNMKQSNQNKQIQITKNDGQSNDLQLITIDPTEVNDNDNETNSFSLNKSNEKNQIIHVKEQYFQKNQESIINKSQN